MWGEVKAFEISSIGYLKLHRVGLDFIRSSTGSCESRRFWRAFERELVASSQFVRLEKEFFIYVLFLWV